VPPSLREWLPEGHLAWFVIDAVAEMDLSAFYAAYRADGLGRAAHEPARMVALLLYAYATGRRASRAIERALRRPVPASPATSTTLGRPGRGLGEHLPKEGKLPLSPYERRSRKRRTRLEIHAFAN
jgi:hypothetical protein